MSENSGDRVSGSVDLARFTSSSCALILRGNYCGKHNCTKCWHGPYWYFAVHHDQKQKVIYVGKSLADLTRVQSSLYRDLIQRVQKTHGLLSDGIEQWEHNTTREIREKHMRQFERRREHENS